MSESSRLYRVTEAAYELAVDLLQAGEGLDALPLKEFADLLGISEHTAGLTRERKSIISTDLLQICQALGFDFGLIVRKPNGDELTFYPARNFGPFSQMQTPPPAKIAAPEATTPPSPGHSVLVTGGNSWNSED